MNLTCLAKGGPGNTFQWVFNGTALDVEYDRLLLPYVTATESGGYYTCTVSNAAGSDNDTTAVFVYPIITLHPTNSFVTQDKRGALTCEATSFPYPENQWVKVDGEIDTQLAINTPMLTFDITNYVEAWEGDYICIATANGLTVEYRAATVFGECSMMFFSYVYNTLFFRSVSI